jgi:hypothetical protein
MPLRQTITSPDATFNGQSTEEHQDPHRPQLDELCIDIWMTESLTTSCGLSRRSWRCPSECGGTVAVRVLYVAVTVSW